MVMISLLFLKQKKIIWVFNRAIIHNFIAIWPGLRSPDLPQYEFIQSKALDQIELSIYEIKPVKKTI